MTTARRVILGVSALLLLGVPRSASAGFGDVIWGLSGPRLYGIVSGCDFIWTAPKPDTPRPAPRCRVLDVGLTKTEDGNPMVAITNGGQGKMWLTLDGIFYFSTGNNSDGVEYKAFNYYMVAFEPLLQVQSVGWGSGALYHGVIGISYDWLFGKGFDSFDNFGVKVRPIGVLLGRHLNLEYNVRIYPRGFTASDFGLVDPKAKPRDSEIVHGFSFGWRW